MKISRITKADFRHQHAIIVAMVWLTALFASTPCAYSRQGCCQETTSCLVEVVDADTAQSRPVTSVYAIEFGGQRALSTYLSPLSYRGFNIAVSGDWRKAMPANPSHLLMNFGGSVSFSRLLNPYGNALMAGFSSAFRWGLAYRMKTCHGWQVSGGADLGLDAGLLYLLRNGNNPVAVNASVNLALTAAVSRPFRIGNLPILLSDEVRLPSLSAFFSPQFGETYYEIYLGNHSGLVHCGWWGNNFRIDNLLALDMDFGKTAMRIGYRFNAYTSWVCNLNTHIFTHSFVIGIIPGGLGLKKRSPRLPNSTIYANY